MLLRRLAGLLIIVTTLGACVGDSPFLTKEEADRLIHDINLGRDPFHEVKNVVAIINNDIYYFNRLDTIPRKLTNSPGALKTFVTLSPDRSRLAYINANGNPVIISTADGKTLQTLTQFNYINQMDWVNNTLFMLIDREVLQFGPTVTIPQPESFHPWDEVTSFSMNNKGDHGYFIDRYDDLSPKKFQYHSTPKNLDKEYNNFGGDLYDYVDFYDDDGNFLLGYRDYFTDAIQYIVCVENYNFNAAYEWDFEPMQSPKFNSQHEILLYGTIEDQGDFDGKYYIKGVYMGTEAYPGSGAYDRLTTVIKKYASNTPVYVDWVQ